MAKQLWIRRHDSSLASFVGFAKRSELQPAFSGMGMMAEVGRDPLDAVRFRQMAGSAPQCLQTPRSPFVPSVCCFPRRAGRVGFDTEAGIISPQNSHPLLDFP